MSQNQADVGVLRERICQPGMHNFCKSVVGCQEQGGSSPPPIDGQGCRCAVMKNPAGAVAALIAPKTDTDQFLRATKIIRRESYLNSLLS